MLENGAFTNRIEHWVGIILFLEHRLKAYTDTDKKALHLNYRFVNFVWHLQRIGKQLASFVCLHRLQRPLLVLLLLCGLLGRCACIGSVLLSRLMCHYQCNFAVNVLSRSVLTVDVCGVHRVSDEFNIKTAQQRRRWRRRQQQRHAATMPRCAIFTEFSPRCIGKNPTLERCWLPCDC